jgi:gas vesicle protein
MKKLQYSSVFHTGYHNQNDTTFIHPKISRSLAQYVELFAHTLPAPHPILAYKNSGKDFPLHSKTMIMNNTSKILLGFIAGAAIGGALGILLAPDKGSETRRKIVEKGADLTDSLSDSLSGFSETVKDKFNDAVDGVKGSFNKTRNSMS